MTPSNNRTDRTVLEDSVRPRISYSRFDVRLHILMHDWIQSRTRREPGEFAKSALIGAKLKVDLSTAMALAICTLITTSAYRTSTHIIMPNDNANDARPGEIALAIDPATLPPDAGIVFIGHAETTYATRKDCPRNSTMQDPSTISTLHIDEPYRTGLKGIDTYSHIIVLYWMHEARRDLMVQNPSHIEGTRGCFALRTPVRPNPISLSVVQLLDSNNLTETGELKIRGIDCVNGTPIVDIKPYYASIDAIKENSELEREKENGHWEVREEVYYVLNTS